MTYLFHLFFYNPLYNVLIYLINHIPGGDVGIATIILTCVVKFILFPLSKKATKTQLKMKALEPELAKLKEQYGQNKEEFAKKTLEFYQKNDLNPFASFFLVLLQLPIIIALSFIFLRSGLPVVNSAYLYSFVPHPLVVSTVFLGILDIGKRSLLLSILAGFAQFVQIQLSLPAYTPAKPDADGKKSFSDDLAQSMNVQMRYVMPVIMFVFAFSVSGAVALYLITGSLFTIGQELYFRRTIKRKI